MDLVSTFIPQNPQLSVLDAEGELPPRLCLDLASEKALQNQRQLIYTFGGPAVALAGLKLQKSEPVFGSFIVALGLACSWWHFKAYETVKYHTGIK